MARKTNLSAEELEDFFQLLPRIFCDYRDPTRGPFKLVYVFSETNSNWDSCFLRAVALANTGSMESLGIAEADLGHGYDGFGQSMLRLKELGWKYRIPIMKFDLKGNANTMSEAVLLAKRAQGLRGDIGVVAPPFHMPRAFMTTVTALKGEPVRVYSIPGTPFPWMERATHSQGTLTNTRAGLLGDELKRLEKYRAPEFGSMLSAREVLEYLDWRDG
jgi:hypothetical protein